MLAAGCVKPTEQGSGPAKPAAPGASSTAGAVKPAGPVTPGTLTPENAKIEFIGSKKDGQHVGGFKQFSGKFSLTGEDATTLSISVDIDTDSIFTDTEKLTGHLKSPDFFEVKTYPKAAFTSTGIKANKEGDATHTVTGDLTLHGVTKSISIPAKITVTPNDLSLDSQFTISRKEYKMLFKPEAVNDEVSIKVTVNASRK